MSQEKFEEQWIKNTVPWGPQIGSMTYEVDLVPQLLQVGSLSIGLHDGNLVIMMEEDERMTGQKLFAVIEGKDAQIAALESLAEFCMKTVEELKGESQ